MHPENVKSMVHFICMRRIHSIIRIFVFLLLFTLVLHGVFRIFKAKDSEELSPYYYDCKKDTFDVIIAGSSVSKNGIQPVQLWENNGIAAYNLSNGNQSLACSYYLLQDAIGRDHPDLIVLDTTYAEDPDIVRSQTFIHYLTDEMPVTDRWRFRMIRDLVPKEDQLEFFWPFYSYHARWKNLTAADFETGTYQKDTLGAVTSSGTMSLSAPLFKKADSDAALPDVSRDYLEKIISLCKENHTALLLFCCPVAGDDGGDVSEDDYNRRRSIMKEVAAIASAENIAFLNFLEDDSVLGLNPYSDFRDGVHLNMWGAEKLTSFLGNYIRQNYDVPDRRTDAYYTNKMEDISSRYASVLREQAFATVSRPDTEFQLLADHLQDSDLIYLVCGQDYNGSSEELSDTIRNGLSSIRLSYDNDYTGLTNIYAVMQGGVLLDCGQEVISSDISWSDTINGCRLEIRTNAMSENADEQHNVICLNDGNVAPAQDGLSIAVIDRLNRKLLDCVTTRYDGSTITHYKEAGE